MPLTLLRLSSGLCLTDPVKLLRKKFEEWVWEKYDGDPVGDANRVESKDVSRVYQLGARSPRRAYEDLSKTFAEEISTCLQRIPANQTLEDECGAFDLLKSDTARLFNIVTNQKAIKIANATKLLAPFRPGLLPVIDSVIENYYWFALSISDETTFRQLEESYRESWGEYVWFLMGLIRKDILGAQTEIDAIRGEFAETAMASISRVRVVESLIWYYYARGQN